MSMSQDYSSKHVRAPGPLSKPKMKQNYIGWRGCRNSGSLTMKSQGKLCSPYWDFSIGEKIARRRYGKTKRSIELYLESGPLERPGLRLCGGKALPPPSWISWTQALVASFKPFSLATRSFSIWTLSG